MASNFSADVRGIVEPVLVGLGFALDAIDDRPDEGGRPQHIVFYRSTDCKVQIYDSARDGSINCMIATLDAENEFGPRDQSGKWQYPLRFVIRQGVPLEEIRKENLTIDFPTTSQRLEWVRGCIEKYFSIAHKGILEMDGPEYWNSGRRSDGYGPSLGS
jgi:hypothetical protein